jgi:tRNA G26 N,N-dimethylase Trm1
METKEGKKRFVTEYNVILLVDKNLTCPKKSEVFYNEEITLNRLRKFLYIFCTIVTSLLFCSLRVNVGYVLAK